MIAVEKPSIAGTAHAPQTRVVVVFKRQLFLLTGGQASGYASTLGVHLIRTQSMTT